MVHSTLRTLICALTCLAFTQVCDAADVVPVKTEAAKGAPKLSPAGNLTAKPGAASTKKLVGGGSEVVTEMAGGLLKSVLGMAAKELLFPSKAIDPEKLLADITANVRKELIEVVMDGDGTALTAATTALHDYETEWKNGGDAGVIEGRVSGDSTINGVNTVIARVGADGMTKYTSIGLPLYLAAAQIKANRLELRRKLNPAQDAAIRAVLVEHLDGAIRHVRATMTSRRMASMSARLSKIAECRISQERTHGLPWDLTTTYETSFTDGDTSSKGRSQADGNSGIALARCEGYRDPYFDNVRRETEPGVDKPWVATNAIVDAWAQSLDVLRNQANVTSRDLKMDFGGMFGIGERAFNNPITNAGTCPQGYYAYEFKGTYNVDWQAFYCGRISASGDPVAEFGGMYGKADHNDGVYWIKNPVTGATTCPAGFEKAAVSNQHELNYCWRKRSTGDKVQYQFGGIYSDNGDKKNPITGDMICPIGYTPGLTHGTRAGGGVPGTRRTIICFAKAPPSS